MADSSARPNRLPVLRLHPNDNVAVVLEPVGADVNIGEGVVTREVIGAGHKVATAPIAAGEGVRKYGQGIGVATRAIEPGEHVHTHNLAFDDGRKRLAVNAFDGWQPPVIKPGRTFDGFLRADGGVATRNYLAVVTSVNCSATVARRIAQMVEGQLGAYANIDGVIAITHAGGCGMGSTGEGMDVLRRTLSGYARHPNVAGALMLGLGCETNNVEALLENEKMVVGDKLGAITIQGEGGTASVIKAGVAQLMAMAEHANQVKRQPLPLAHLTLGLQCGGSDGYSGVTANPALGVASDLLVAHGGAAILSETPEIYGAEHLLTNRAERPDIADALMARIAWWESHVAAVGGSMDNNPSTGNKAGGLTTILEKSLGAVAKAGASPLRAVYEYAEPVTERGLVFMDTPGYDPVSATGQIAGGANIVCFTTGRGSVFGSKPAPCLKLSTNTDLYRRMSGDMDVDCGRILSEGVSIEEMGHDVFELIVATASGRRSKSEEFNFGDEEIQPWRIGATM
jgi:altronate hydrolase